MFTWGGKSVTTVFRPDISARNIVPDGLTDWPESPTGGVVLGEG